MTQIHTAMLAAIVVLLAGVLLAITLPRIDTRSELERALDGARETMREHEHLF